jgi:hypothetical protein
MTSHGNQSLACLAYLLLVGSQTLYYMRMSTVSALLLDALKNLRVESADGRWCDHIVCAECATDLRVRVLIMDNRSIEIRLTV